MVMGVLSFKPDSVEGFGRLYVYDAEGSKSEASPSFRSA